MDLDIKIDPNLLQIRLRSTHRYPNPIQIHFKPIQIQSDWIWITWILDQIQSIAIPRWWDLEVIAVRDKTQVMVWPNSDKINSVSSGVAVAFHKSTT